MAHLTELRGEAAHACIFHGSCECGAVRYEVELALASSPTPGGSVWERAVPARAFRLLAGDESLRGYQFVADGAHHFFCERCGIRSFSHHLGAAGATPEDFYSIDLKRLDTRAPAERAR